MSRYLLDTNILSYLIDTASSSHDLVHSRLAGLADEDEVTLSILSLYKLHHWFSYDPAHEPLAGEVIRDFTLLPLPEQGATRFGLLMRALCSDRSRGGVRRHAIDCMIAVTALERGATLVSGDAVFVRLAKQAPTIRCEDWTIP